MKNTIIITVEDATKQFVDTMIDMINADLKEIYIEDSINDIAQLAEDSRALISEDNVICFDKFREMFKAGFTMNLLKADEFEQIDIWVHNSEQFQIAIFRNDGTPVGVVPGDSVSY